MKLPPLPEPEIIDGGRPYTAGQMREYARMCVGLIAPKVNNVDQAFGKNFSKPASNPVSDLMGIFGMTK